MLPMPALQVMDSAANVRRRRLWVFFLVAIRNLGFVKYEDEGEDLGLYRDE